jgi:predicted AAA+ superfamily ATPase
LTTKQKGQMMKLSNEYMISGGIPDALKYTNLEIHKTLYDDVIYRDIATRYPVTHVKSLKELAFYFMSNISSLFSFNKLKELLKLGSVNTVKSYAEHLENSWLFFVINKYAYSVKEQQIAAKKIYCVDTGFARSVGFSFSGNYGKFMENLTFLELRRGRHDMYYYRTANDYEVDFFIPKHKAFIQVVKNMDDGITRKREIRALLEAAGEQKEVTRLFIVTEREKNIIRQNGRSIHVIPLYEWLLDFSSKLRYYDII